MSERAVIFGLDGATYRILDHLVAQGVMPFFAEAFTRGARAGLMSTVPPLTPPAWITLATGRSPATSVRKPGSSGAREEHFTSPRLRSARTTTQRLPAGSSDRSTP